MNTDMIKIAQEVAIQAMRIALMDKVDAELVKQVESDVRIYLRLK